MKEIISLDQYFQDFSTKEDRRKQYPVDFTQQIQFNAQKLLGLVNQFLAELGIQSDKKIQELEAKISAVEKNTEERLRDIEILKASVTGMKLASTVRPSGIR